MEPVETLSKVINEKEIFFYFLKMKLSIFIWVGQSPATMKQLSVAMNLPVSAYTFNYAIKLFSKESFIFTNSTAR